MAGSSAVVQARSVSFRRAPGSNVLRWVLNWSYFQVSSGCDAAGSPPRPPPPRPRPATAGSRGGAGGPLTTGAENCIEVFLRIRTTKSRISTYRARRVSASLALSCAGCRRRQGLPHGLQLGDGTNLSGSRLGRSGRFTKDPPNQRQILRRDLLSLARRW